MNREINIAYCRFHVLNDDETNSKNEILYNNIIDDIVLKNNSEGIVCDVFLKTKEKK